MRRLIIARAEIIFIIFSKRRVHINFKPNSLQLESNITLIKDNPLSKGLVIVRRYKEGLVFVSNSITNKYFKGVKDVQ